MKEEPDNITAELTVVQSSELERAVATDMLMEDRPLQEILNGKTNSNDGAEDISMQDA